MGTEDGNRQDAQSGDMIFDAGSSLGLRLFAGLAIPHPILLAACNLDFLCIHPFRDGNGRVSRLLLLLQSYYCGYEVGRYVSFERLIEINKERYYETLETSSRDWHEGKHDPWPYIQFILYIFKSAYKEFEEKIGQMTLPRGEKQEMINSFIAKTTESFTIRDIQLSYPNISIDMIRHVLKALQKKRMVKYIGRGQKAQWQKVQKGTR